MSACVLDTDVVIAALDRRDAHHARASAAVTAWIDAGTDLLLSLVNYAETLVRPAENHDTMRAAIEALTALGIRLVAPTPAIARDAARYGDRTSASPMVSPSRRRRAMVRASRRSTFACGERFLRSAWSWRQRCPELQR